jgi:trans-2,3-dihydro-3-hydroxyanthranilate isomerase
MDFHVYDVFTDTPFGGNPLAVFYEAQDLPTDRLQAIARELNFSETTFVYPPTSGEHQAKVRIFTPTNEVPFAGHPTIGTALALYNLGAPAKMILEMGVGPIQCEITDKGASFITPTPLAPLVDIPTSLIANALGLDDIAIQTKTHGPILASVGLPFIFVELVNDTALAQIECNLAAFKKSYAEFPASWDFSIFAYTRDKSKINARMFSPLGGIPEDPATGSACAALCAFLSERLETPQDLIITQGVQMGRPSRIAARKLPQGIKIAGNAVKTMEGRFLI